MSDINASLRQADPEVYEAIKREEKRQNDKIILIASENYASMAVLEAQGSVLTNKYAEGYPGRRYYGGCENVDYIEALAIERAKELFEADHANVQPHSGSTANQAVYMAFMKPGDTYLAMELAHGGHLTHGSPVNFSGMQYNVCAYGVDAQTELIDYDALQKQALECRPKMIVTGATVYPRFWDWERLRKIADSVDAILMSDIAHIAGLVAGGEHPSPVPYCDVVTFTTHKTLRGPRSGLIVCKEQYAKAIDKAVFPGLQGGPLEHVIAAKAVCLHEAMQPSFKDYQRQIRLNAKAMADALMARGLRLVSGGTDNHLMLVDVSTLGLTGKVAQEVLDVDRHRREQEHDPVRSAEADGHQRPAAGHAVRDYSRDERAGDGENRRHDRPLPQAHGRQPRGHRRARAGRQRGQGTDRGVSDLHGVVRS